MRFAPIDVLADAYDELSAFLVTNVPADWAARQITTILMELTQKVAEDNPERLNTFIVVPNSTVQEFDDYVDLTISNTVEWLRIDGIDFRGENDDGFYQQVGIFSLEARNRVNQELAYMRVPTGYLYDHQTKLAKANDWTAIYELRIMGIPVVSQLTVDNLDQLMDYPHALYQALRWRLVERMLGRAQGIPDFERQRIHMEAKDALQGLYRDAVDFATPGVVTMDVPRAETY